MDSLRLDSSGNLVVADGPKEAFCCRHVLPPQRQSAQLLQQQQQLQQRQQWRQRQGKGEWFWLVISGVLACQGFWVETVCVRVASSDEF